MEKQLPDSEFKDRIHRIQEKLTENNYDAYLVHCNEADQANVRYLSDHWPIFETAGVKAEIPADIHKAIWEKFLFVAAAGGVGAARDETFGEIRELPQSRRMLELDSRDFSHPSSG